MTKFEENIENKENETQRATQRTAKRNLFGAADGEKIRSLLKIEIEQQVKVCCIQVLIFIIFLICFKNLIKK